MPVQTQQAIAADKSYMREGGIVNATDKIIDLFIVLFGSEE